MTSVRARRAVSGDRRQDRAAMPVRRPVRYHRRALLLAVFCVQARHHATEGVFMERLFADPPALTLLTASPGGSAA